MKTIACALFLIAALAGFGQPAGTGPSQPITVRVASEVEDLARGYATAFPGITRIPVYLNLRREGGVVTLVSVKAVKAVAGVLVVELDNGFTYLLNPEDVVSITDAPPPKGPPAAPRP